MKTILFIILPYPSHYFACYSYAHYWQKRGYKIVFTGIKTNNKLVTSEKFNIVEYKYLKSFNIDSFSIFIGLLIKSIFDQKNLRKRYKDFYASKISLEQIIQNIKPNKIFIDECIAEHYFFCKNQCTNIKIVNTRPSTKKAFGIPPLDSTFSPNQGIFSTLYCEFLWLKQFSKLKLKDVLSSVTFLGLDENFFLRRLTKKKGWNYNSLLCKQHSFYRSIKEIETVNLIPKSFELPQKKRFPNETYFHSITKRNESHYFSEKYLQLINLLKVPVRLKVIYVSFGTLSNSKLIHIRKFYLQLIEVVKSMDNTLLVIAKGTSKLLLPEEDFLYVFDYIPQINFLSYCDLMINHGGIGSIKECIDKKVPMICVPINKNVDQPGCSTRVVLHKLGLRLNLKKSNYSQISLSINTLLSNDGFCKINNKF